MISKEMVRHAVHEGLKEVLKKDEVGIRDDETFSNYGVDSLDQMNLIIELEKILKLDLADLNLEESHSINLVHSFISRKHA